MSPVAFVERRVAQHDVGAERGKGVRAEAVTGGGPHGGLALERQPQRGERREFGRAVLPEQLLSGPGGHGAQQGAGAARRVECGACRSREFRHQRREAGGGERVLTGVGVEVAPQKELVRLAGAQLGGQFGGAAQQGAEVSSSGPAGVFTARSRGGRTSG